MTWILWKNFSKQHFKNVPWYIDLEIVKLFPSVKIGVIERGPWRIPLFFDKSFGKNRVAYVYEGILSTWRKWVKQKKRWWQRRIKFIKIWKTNWWISLWFWNKKTTKGATWQIYDGFYRRGYPAYCRRGFNTNLLSYIKDFGIFKKIIDKTYLPSKERTSSASTTVASPSSQHSERRTRACPFISNWRRASWNSDSS